MADDFVYGDKFTPAMLVAKVSDRVGPTKHQMLLEFLAEMGPDCSTAALIAFARGKNWIPMAETFAELCNQKSGAKEPFDFSASKSLKEEREKANAERKAERKAIKEAKIKESLAKLEETTAVEPVLETVETKVE